MTKANNAKRTFVMQNDTLDFSKKGGHVFKHLGTAVLVEIKRGRVQDKYIVAVQTGPYAGTNRILTLRHEHASGGELFYYCDIVGENKKVAEAKRTEKREMENKRFKAAAEASTKIEAGDIIRVQTSKHVWNMKVLEVDFKKGRVYGVNADSRNPSSKRAWASLTHSEVKLTMVTKKAFDPRTDETVAMQQERAAKAGAKRATTRARKAEVRDLFAFLNNR